MNQQKTVLITGATSGIGAACAHIFVQNGFKVIISGRRVEKLDTLKEELSAKYNSKVLSLPFDVRSFEETDDAIKNLPKEWSQIDILINNAGLALGILPIQEGNLEDWNQMIDTNLKGILHVSKCVIPSMTARNSGHIINIGSIAGKETYLNGNVYCASKAAVDALTKAMRIDLLKFGIKVTQVAPGAVETEFSMVRFKGNGDAAQKIYEGFKPLTAMDVAGVVYYTATLPAHVNINDVIVVPTAQANTTHTFKNV